MSRWRSSMVLLAIAVLATVIGFLRVITEPTPLPPGSSYSRQPDGSLALFTWLGELGASPSRDTEGKASALFVIQPTSVSRQLIDSVADGGGTIVLAGDSIQWLLNTRALGVTVEPVQASDGDVTTTDGLRLSLGSRYRLRADGAEPLLVREDGRIAALRKPYHAGTLIVIASSEPLSNAGLRDPATARFVFRSIVSPLARAHSAVAFDEAGRPGVASVRAPTTANQLLFGTAPGRAVLYACALIFVYLLLAGRRLGPAILPRSAAQSQRTMYEHVQMLADLYRRAGRLAVVRETLGRHYARHDPVAAARILSARTESDLIAVINDAH